MSLLVIKISLLLLAGLLSPADCLCSRGCDLALASYYMWPNSNLTFINEVTGVPIPTILSYNPQIPNQDSVIAGTRTNIPFSCECISGEFLGHVFTYDVRSRDTYTTIAEQYYSNLTTVQLLTRFNSYPEFNIPDKGRVNVTVSCSCGDKDVSKDYGLFVTYPLRPGESLESVANANNLSSTLLRSYNPASNFSDGVSVVYIPGKDQNGTYPPLNSSTGLSGGIIAGISVAGVVGVLLFSGCLYVGYLRKKKAAKIRLFSGVSEAPRGTPIHASDSAVTRDGTSNGLTGITVDKSVEFSYEELASATNDFDLANKIGEGGFGSVYYAELRESCNKENGYASQ